MTLKQLELIETIDIEGAKAGSGKAYKPVREDDSKATIAYLSVLYGLSEGVVRGFGVNAWTVAELKKSVYLDGTPIMSQDGTILHEDVEVDFRYGTIDQTPIEGMPSVTIESVVGVEVRADTPITRNFLRKEANSYDVRISIPRLMQNTNEGDSRKGEVTFAIDVATGSGSFSEYGVYTINEKITQGFQRTYNITIPQAASRSIRVRKLTSDGDNTLTFNDITLEAITEVVEVRLSYPHTALLWLKYDARNFSNAPKVEVLLHGIADMQIPMNYNPDTRQYATSGAGTTNGVWNGQFKTGYTDNPAWHWFLMATNKRYSLGNKITESLTNKFYLYSLAKYCDELVPDGKGGQEPRFTCNNLYLQKQEDAFKVMKDLASVFRAKTIWDGMYLTPKMDTPRDAMLVFSRANVNNITYASTSGAAQHNVVAVQFYDTDNHYDTKFAYARSVENIRQRGRIEQIEVTALGCTSEGQAQRYADYLLNTELLETELISFTTGLDGMRPVVGDVFVFADDLVAGKATSGRVVSVAANKVVVDRDLNIALDVGGTFIANTTETLASTRTITAIAADKRTVTLSSAINVVDITGLVWAVKSSNVGLREYTVDDVSYDADTFTFAVTGIKYARGKYSSADNAAHIVEPPLTLIEPLFPKQPDIVTAKYYVVVEQGMNLSNIEAAWSQVTSAAKYELEMRRDGGEWRKLGETQSLTYTVENAYAGVYEFRVRSFDVIGNASMYRVSAPLLVKGKVLPPPMLEQLTVKGELFAIRADWVYPAASEDSLSVVIEINTEDPAVSTANKTTMEVAYPATSFTFTGLSAHARLWLRAAIKDRYGNVGAFTVWTDATADSNPSAILDIIEGEINAGTLDQALRDKIEIGVVAKTIADNAQTTATNAASAAAAAATAATTAQNTANTAKTNAATAQTAANNAATAASAAQTTATNAATSATSAATAAANAASAITQEVTDRKAAVTQEVTDRKAAVTLEKNERVAAVQAVADGVTTEINNRVAGDSANLSVINTYKTSNDAALAAVRTETQNNTTANSAQAEQLTLVTATLDNGAKGLSITGTLPSIKQIIGTPTTNVGLVTDATTSSGQAIEFGDNSGNDFYGTIFDQLMPIDANKLYRVRYRYKRVSGTGSVYLALMPLNADKTKGITQGNTEVNANTLSAAHYFVTASVSALDLWVEGEFYFKGKAAGAVTGTGTKASPRTFAQKSAFARFAVLPNYSNQSGVVRIDYLILEDAEAIAAAETNASAITTTKADVTRIDGAVTAHSSQLSLLDANLTTLTGTVATKANTSALNAVDARVTVVDGKTVTNATNITSLTGRVATAEAGLVSNAAAINNTYTKTQADAATAGQISSYDVQLTIGAENLYLSENPIVLIGQTGAGVYKSTVATSAAAQMYTYFNTTTKQLDISGLNKDDPTVVSIEVMIPSSNTVDFNFNFGSYRFSASSYLLTPLMNTASMLKDVWIKISAPAGKISELGAASVTNINVVFNISGANRPVGTEIRWRNLMMERGTKASAYRESTAVLKNTINANATAINTTNSEVSRVNGVVVAHGVQLTALSSSISTINGTLATKADSSALTSLTNRVTAAEGVNTTQSTSITALQNSLTTTNNNLATKADTTALNTLDSKVTAVDGRVTSNAGSITSLTNRVTNVEGTVATKAEAAALTALTTRVTNTEGVNTSQGSAITTLQNTVNHATTGLATKASTSALTATNSEVSRVNGVVTGHTSQLTQLESDITTINGNLATKANASALNDIYTKTQTDAKALEISAGEVNKYDASLSIGIDNLLPTQIDLWEDGYWNTSSGAATSGAAYSRTKADVQIPVIAGEKYSLRSNTRTVFVFYSAENARTGFHESGTSTPPTTAQVITIPANTAYARVYLFAANGTMAKPVPFNQAALTALQGMIVRGEHTKLVWQPSSLGSSNQINANATAIQITNAEVTRVDGRVTTESNRITSLTGRVDTVEGAVSTKADASALNSLTTRVVTEEGKSTSQGTAITALQNTVNHATTGLSTKASSAALTAVDNKVTAVDGRVNTTNSNVVALTGRVSTVEGGLATKADVSALNNIYTKSEADAKATSLAAGEVSKYDASLVIGGTNLLRNSNFTNELVGWEVGSGATVTVVDDTIATFKKVAKVVSTATTSGLKVTSAAALNVLNLTLGEEYTFSGWLRADAAMTVYVAIDGSANTNATAVSVGVEWVKFTHTKKASDNRIPRLYGSGTFYAANLKIERGNKATDWSEADSAIVDSLNANATAITTTNAEVSRVNGVVVSQGTQLTTLSNSISTINGTLSTKADTSALTALTTRVTAAEGVNTSQGTSITNLNNSITTINGTLSNKADSSALNTLASRVTTAEGTIASTSDSVLKLSNSLAPALNEIRLVPNSATIANLNPLRTDAAISLIDDATTTAPKVLSIGAGAAYNMFSTSDLSFDDNKLYKIRYRTKRTAGTGAFYLGMMPLSSDKLNSVSSSNALLTPLTLSSAMYPLTGTTAAAPLNSWVEGVYYIKGRAAAASTGLGTFASPRTMPNLGAFLRLCFIVPASTTFSLEYFILEDAEAEMGDKVNADAIVVTNNEASRINGVVVSQGSQISTLTNSLATTNGNVALKADTSALTATNTRLTAAEGKIDNQASQVTNLTASVATALDAVTISDTRSTNQPPSWYLATYPRRLVNEFKTQTAIGVGGFFGGTYCNLETKVYYTDLSGGDIIQTATSSVDPSLYVQRRSNGVSAWTAWAQPLKDIRDGLDQKATAAAHNALVVRVTNAEGVNTAQATSITNLNSAIADKADASAVTSLTTRVSNAEGVNTSQATSITNLSSTVSGQTTTISNQSTTIDGIKAVHAFKIDNNGVITGYGLVSELINGVVKSQFGVNADTFFVGNPTSGKKPFIVLTGSGTINGVVVPAGTYIDTAFIADLTVTSAKIADLGVTNAKIDNLAVDGAKIANAAITTAKIGDLQVDTLKIKDNAVTVTTVYYVDSYQFNTATAYSSYTGWWAANHTVQYKNDGIYATARLGNITLGSYTGTVMVTLTIGHMYAGGAYPFIFIQRIATGEVRQHRFLSNSGGGTICIRSVWQNVAANEQFGFFFATGSGQQGTQITIGMTSFTLEGAKK